MQSNPNHNRLIWLDLTRGLSVLAMIVFHFSFDLMYFGFARSGLVYEPAWRLFETCIASSFLFLAGISFVAAHGDAVNFKKWQKQIAILIVLAGLISTATFFIFGDNMIQFGILHVIAAMMIFGLGLRRMPVLGLFAMAFGMVGAFIWWAPIDAPSLYSSIILTKSTAFAVDYRPILPWGAAFVFGMALWKVLPARLKTQRPSPMERIIFPVLWLGRHSLGVYICHQPILFALFYLALAVGIGPSQ